MEGERGNVEVEIRPMRSGVDAEAFREFNEEWITLDFSLEPKDVQTLGDPEGAIVDQGGKVFVAYAGGEAVACVALVALGEGVFELSKMAVRPGMRGGGIGRRVLEYAIARAREMGARSFVLRSSTKLPYAVHLYEDVGFRHVLPEMLPGLAYRRAMCLWR